MMNSNFLFIYLMMMYNLLFMIMMIPSNLFKFHPLFLMLLLVLYIFFLSVYMSFFLSTYWYSYIIFLVMIGGMMILFMYFTSLLGNQLSILEKNYYLYLFMKFLFLLLINLMIIYNFDFFLNLISFCSKELYMYISMLDNCEILMIKDLMMDYNLNLNLYMIIYLFFTMICSVLICGKLMIPMRQLIKF